MSTEVGEHRFLNMDMRWKHAALERMRETSTHLSCESVYRGHELLTGHVENGVCLGLFFYKPDGLTGRYDDQFDVAALRLKFHFFHN